MNHPPKKKKKNPLLPENNQVDERQLIDAEDSANISLEDRINIYWNDNKGFLVGCVIVLLIGIIGYQGMRIVKENTEAKIQSEYTAANSSGTLESFVDAHASKPLGGFASLIIADEAYIKEDYEKALEFYTLATSSTLTDPMLTGRAHIGQAFALYNKGKTDEGLAKLNAITIDTSLSSAIRVEAAYHLAMDAHAAGRTEEFASYVKQVESADFADQWQQRIALINN